MNRRDSIRREIHELSYARWEIVPALLYPWRRMQRRPTPVTFRMLGSFGRLGNQLFQIAGTLSLAAARGAPVVLPDWEYRRWFSVPDDVFTTDRTTLLGARESFRYTGRIRPRRDRFFFQRYRFVEPVADELRRWFRPSAEAQAAVEGLLPEGHLTAIHVRRGDYVPNSYFVLLPPEYYLEAAEAVAVPGTRFVVFSDAPEWCREELAPRLESLGPVTVVEGNADWLDLFLIAKCDRHVVSNSTYAWWGAFLSGDPEPARPSRFLSDPNSPRTEIFPPSWRTIDV